MKNKLILFGTLTGVVVFFLFVSQSWFQPLERVGDQAVAETEKILEPKMMETAPDADMKTADFHFHAVPNEEVCMVNNVYGGKKMIPVPVDDKTYYACCGHCVGQLTEYESARFSRDPHTMQKVDKSLAHIVLAPGRNGDVVYFQSESSLTEGSVMINKK